MTKTTPFGPGDEATWGPYEGHPNDPRAPLEDDLDAAYADAAAHDELMQAMAYGKALCALIEAAHGALADLVPPPGHPEWPSAIALRKALDDFQPWLEGVDSQDPRENGWVDSKGRP